MNMYAYKRVSTHAYTRWGLGTVAWEFEGLVSVSVWWVYINSWGTASSWGSVPWKLRVSGTPPTFDQSFLSATVQTQSVPVQGLELGLQGGPSSARICANSSRSFFALLLLPDGKNQLLLALLKCTGEGFAAATL